MRLLIPFLTIVLTSCSSSRAPLYTIYPQIQDSDVPSLEFFKKDRTAEDGSKNPLIATRSFMQAVFSAPYSAKLLHDPSFCRRHLSSGLRKRLATSKLQFDRRIIGKKTRWGDAHPAQSANRETILDAWDSPTSFRIAGHHMTKRSYRVADESHTDENAVVDVIYIWGKGRQYEGFQRLTSVILTKENGRWYIDDLYTNSGIYCFPDHLYGYLVQKTNP